MVPTTIYRPLGSFRGDGNHLQQPLGLLQSGLDHLQPTLEVTSKWSRPLKSTVSVDPKWSRPPATYLWGCSRMVSTTKIDCQCCIGVIPTTCSLPLESPQSGPDQPQSTLRITEERLEVEDPSKKMSAGQIDSDRLAYTTSTQRIVPTGEVGFATKE